MTSTNLAHLSMQDLFRVEARAQAQALTDGLLVLEKDPRRADQLEACMRAAHSLKGAARIVDIGGGVTVAHAMEEVFVAAQDGRLLLTQSHIDALLEGVDLLTAIANAPGSDGDEAWEDEADRYATMLARIEEDETGTDRAGEVHAGVPSVDLHAGVPPVLALAVPEIPEPVVARSVPAPAPPPPPAEASDAEAAAGERAMRVSADNLNRLLDLAGESLVESRRLKPLAQSLLRLKRLHRQAAQSIETLRETLTAQTQGEDVGTALLASERAILACKQFLVERLSEFEAAEHHATALAHRLYDQALTVRMRPFADGVTAFPRMVRDVGRSLGKTARLEVLGLTTQVDRDIMERLDAPLGHLLRNAVDHGLETPGERAAAGKPPEGVIVLEAHHSAGTLQILVSDDGRGIDLERLRATVVRRKLATDDTAARLSEAELLEFLFLPGFTMKDEVTRISGRGVGLDVVRDMVKQVGGLVQVTSRPGRGTRFQLQLPLTLSVIRALLVEISGETYAFSFGQILRAIKVPRNEVGVTEGRQFFTLGEKKVGLAAAHQILDTGDPPTGEDALCVVVIGSLQNMYGVVVDRFIGGRELVVQKLDPRLGKIKDVSAGAVMEDGSPLLILDAEDMVRSIEKLASSDRLHVVERRQAETGGHRHRKSVLVVDDSFTVRELQRKLLDHNGYHVEVAVDGMDGWNALRAGAFDLVITDVDMPRMDGIRLTEMIKKDQRLNTVPVMILSYKDREDDRRRGLDAGADYYLTKGSYQSDALIDAVIDLIGEAQA